MSKQRGKASAAIDLMNGSIAKGILSFAVPIFVGQLLQQLYNMADAWVVGNFADNDAFAAVSSAGNLIFLIIGFFNGIAIGGGVIISKFYGAGDKEQVSKAIHTNFLFGIISSILATVVGLLLIPQLLRMMNTPDSVLPQSLVYFRIYFAGVITVVMYNICMAIMRALGDSLHPLYYLVISSVVNIILDLLFVAVFHWGVAGAAIATVAAQGISVVLCIVRMCRAKDDMHLDFRKLKFHKDIMKEVVRQGLPSGVQNSVISIGNIVIQANINAFGAYAMSGQGAYVKIEGFVFLPIMSMSMALPTFISQNLGAKKTDRAKKGALFGILCGIILAEVIGVIVFLYGKYALRIFVDSPEAIAYGTTHAKITSLFYFLLAFSHCAAGVLRGCGKSIIPMIAMLTCWCAIRIVYVTIAVKIIPEYYMVAMAYPITWFLSSVLFFVSLFKSNWTKIQ